MIFYIHSDCPHLCTNRGKTIFYVYIIAAEKCCKCYSFGIVTPNCLTQGHRRA